MEPALGDESDGVASHAEILFFGDSQEGHDVQSVLRTALFLMGEDLEREQVPALGHRESEARKDLDSFGRSDDLRLDARRSEQEVGGSLANGAATESEARGCQAPRHGLLQDVVQLVSATLESVNDVFGFRVRLHRDSEIYIERGARPGTHSYGETPNESTSVAELGEVT